MDIRLAAEKALKWIECNTINGKGIAVTSKNKLIYPEVTGYYIPTLIEWGKLDMAKAYARYLCGIQKKDGSWYDSTDSDPYVFDSCQVIKGLISIRNFLPEVDENIVNGIEWVLSNMLPSSRLTTPSENAWGNDEDFCSELVHIYCLSPIYDAGNIFARDDFRNKADKILEFYKSNKMEQIQNFSMLSHFYAYVMEGLFDIGEIELCRKAMMRMENYRNECGGIPGLKNVHWICSTGMFQLAIVWYKLGETSRGDTLLNYATSLQNESGGWYGSYPVAFGKDIDGKENKPYYFPKEEISWANKFFLDALYYKRKAEEK